MGAKKISAISGFSIKDIKEARSHLRHQRRQCYNSQVKILIFDIETSPLKGFVWSRWKQNIYLDQTIAEWFMISWSAKWVGSDIMYSDVLTPEEILKEDDKRITGGIWKLLDEADIVVAHNGKRFDIPKLNSRFILNRLSPPAPYKQIDTKEVSAR
jgi:DNA polymerase elongation subunit (family B)